MNHQDLLPLAMTVLAFLFQRESERGAHLATPEIEVQHKQFYWLMKLQHIVAWRKHDLE